MTRLGLLTVCFISFACAVAQNDSTKVDSINNNINCYKDTVHENEIVLTKDKYIVINVEDMTPKDKESWKEKYAGVILGTILGFLSGIITFYLQQTIKTCLSKKTKIEDYKQAIDNYIDYVIAGACDSDKIKYAKNLIFPTEGPYIKECKTKIFEEKINNIRDLLIKYQRNEIVLIKLNEELKKQKFNNE
jgi:hypothetical protein